MLRRSMPQAVSFSLVMAFIILNASAARALAASTPPATAAAASPAPGAPNDPDYWVEAMRKTHARFTGKRGTFAHFGDSITVTLAFWAPLADEHKNLDPEAEKTYELVKHYMQPECWRNWKGPENGSQGGMQITWAEQNVDRWLKKLNPETALILFGTNDLREGRSVDDYIKRTRGVVQKCLDNGTVVILSTVPPRTRKLEESKAYAEAIRKLGREMNVPVEDFFQAVISRRGDDWNGSDDKFKDVKNPYEVPTLISGDGVHPSAPHQFAGDYSETALKNSGYNLRSYLTLIAYGEVIRAVLEPQK